MSERLNLIVEDGVSAMLAELADGERKRGQWISNLVKAMHGQRQQLAVSDIDQIKVGFAGLVGTTKMLEGRMLRLEQQFADLAAQRSA